MTYLQQAEVNPAIVQAQVNFFRAVLDDIHLESLETALALEQIAGEIKERLAEKWALTNEH